MEVRAVIVSIGLALLAGAGMGAQAGRGAVKQPSGASRASEKLPSGVSADWAKIDWQIVTERLNADVYKNFEPASVLEAVEWYMSSEWRDQGGSLYGSLTGANGKRLECKEWKKEVLKRLLTPEPDPKGYNRLRDVVLDYFSEVSDTRGHLDIVDPCNQ